VAPRATDRLKSARVLLRPIRRSQR
jgi:hypothetical protein